MTRNTQPTYSAAIQWLALNDDNAWAHDPEGSPSVTAWLVTDLWGRTIAETRAKLLTEIKREQAAHEARTTTRT